MGRSDFKRYNSFKTRQERRASIYARRARQLRRRKVAGCFAVLGVVGVLLSVRVIAAFRERDLNTSELLAKAEVNGVTRALEQPRYVPQVPVVIPEPEPVYKPAVTLARSADADSFFDGYEALVTADTVRIPANRGTAVSDSEETEPQSQGSSDYEENALAVPVSGDDVFLDSESAVLINLDTGEIVAERNADRSIYPASMTKVLTLLVANEQMTDRNGTFTITKDITDHTYSNDLSAVCWDVGEQITVEDMEYGTILPSGADAAIGLARYAVGSEERFVELMNDKCEAMGLSPHASFTNVTGMHDDNEHCTVTDMAMIMKAAVEYDHVLEVMRAGEYRTSKTEEHPDGVYMFNLFLDRTQVAEAQGRLRGKVVCAKTGYTNESKNCAVTYYVSETGGHYVCVTALGHGSRRVVDDHINLYNRYAR